MRYWIVFLATLIAVFWDECVIALVSLVFKQKLSAKFIIIWTVLSGILAGMLVSLHMPEEFRSITIILIGIAVLFSINNTNHNNQNKN